MGEHGSVSVNLPLSVESPFFPDGGFDGLSGQGMGKGIRCGGMSPSAQAEAVVLGQ